jgi:hypothetical protein
MIPLDCCNFSMIKCDFELVFFKCQEDIMETVKKKKKSVVTREEGRGG